MKTRLEVDVRVQPLIRAAIKNLKRIKSLGSDGENVQISLKHKERWVQLYRLTLSAHLVDNRDAKRVEDLITSLYNNSNKLSRLNPYLGSIGNYQYWFRSGKSAAKLVSTLWQILEKSREFKIDIEDWTS